MNKAAVRRALTTLKKNNLMHNVTVYEGRFYFETTVDAELIQPKKKIYIRKTKKKKDANN